MEPIQNQVTFQEVEERELVMHDGKPCSAKRGKKPAKKKPGINSKLKKIPAKRKKRGY
jgi:hypothetical protein